MIGGEVLICEVESGGQVAPVGRDPPGWRNQPVAAERAEAS
jgi:hypothetical protein